MELLITGFLLSLSLCFDLGIVNVAIIKTGIEKGFYPSFNIGLGSTIGDLMYAALAIAGVTLIFKFLLIKWILWIAGTGFLLFYSYKMMIHTIHPPVEMQTKISVFGKNGSLKKYFLGGFALALSSPTAIIWFATVGGSIVANQTLHSYPDFFYFFFGFFCCSVSWSFALAYISHKGGQVMKKKLKRMLSLISALMFIALAVYIFIDGYNNLVRGK